MNIATISKGNTDLPFANPVAGTLAGFLDWKNLEQIWQNIKQASDGSWHIYYNDNPLPGDIRPSDVDISGDLASSIDSLDSYLHKAHPRNYCGMVFADSLTEPSLIRIFDPKYLTSMCNIYGNTPAPSWIISTIDSLKLESEDAVSSKLQNHSLGKELPVPPKHPQAADTLDARRMGCPLPLIHTARSLKRLAIGEILEIVTIDPGAVNDIEYLCECTGAKHLALAEGEYGYSFYVERRELNNTNNLNEITQEFQR